MSDTPPLEPPVARLIIVMDGGLVESVYADGIDLSHVTVFKIDYDTEGADKEDLIPVGDTDAYFTPMAIEVADDEMSRDVRRAYGEWLLRP